MFGYVMVRNCPGGSCQCPANLASCSALCVDEQTDVKNCGSCGNNCAAKPNVASATCSAGSCVTTCSGSTTDCDPAAGNGCEDLTSDAKNCGACGHACGAGEICAGSACHGPNLTIVNPNGATVTFAPHYPGDWNWSPAGTCTAASCTTYVTPGNGSGGFWGGAGTNAIVRVRSTRGFASGCDAYGNDCYLTHLPATLVSN
jgi:hypothetical protein